MKLQFVDRADVLRCVQLASIQAVIWKTSTWKPYFREILPRPWKRLGTLWVWPFRDCWRSGMCTKPSYSHGPSCGNFRDPRVGWRYSRYRGLGLNVEDLVPTEWAWSTGLRRKFLRFSAMGTAKDWRSSSLSDGVINLLFGSLFHLIMPGISYHTKRILTHVQA